MKKHFDKYIAQSSKGQMLALSCMFVVVVIIGAIIGPIILTGGKETIVKFGYDWLWGLMNCIGATGIGDTLQSSAQIVEGSDMVAQPAWWVIVISILFWAIGIVLASFFTGTITNFLDARRGNILSGNVDYNFTKDYILIVGVDFQVKNLIKSLMTRHQSSSIVVLTDGMISNIYETVNNELSDDETHRLYIMRKDICSAESYARFCLHGAKEIFVIGDAHTSGRDGMSLKALNVISKCIKEEKIGLKSMPIKTYLHIEDFVFFSQVRAMKIPADENQDIELEIVNYYESWAWKCWSQKDANDGRDNYLPIRNREGTTRTELFVIGASKMGRAMVNFAMPIMNYGASDKSSRITIFDVDILNKGFLPDRETLQNLPEVEVRYEAIDGRSDEANDIMLRAVERKDTSVTIVIAISEPAIALRTYAELSNRLRRNVVSVLIWQATSSWTCLDKKYLKLGGDDAIADKTNVCYFGMTDVLPWMDTSRYEYGMAINFFYNSWFPYDSPFPVSPKATDSKLVKEVKQMWNAQVSADSNSNVISAQEMWAKIPRWKKWSSINSGDSLREKSVMFKDFPYEKAAELALRAEHNRWWTEKLLLGWLLDPKAFVHDGSHADKKQMLHGDLVPFERLSEIVVDKDKINLAALVVFGFLD